MRLPPDYILREVKKRDPDLWIKWDMVYHQWKLMWKDRNVCVLRHVNGKPMIELCLDEILEKIGASDNHRDGGDRLKALLRHADERQYQVELRKRATLEESRKETESRTKVFGQGGSSPFVHMAGLNPLATA